MAVRGAKAGRAKKLTALERQTRDATDRNHIAWARRHPERAAAERALRKQRAQLLDRWSHKGQGTPETHEHHNNPRPGSIARLYQSGAIDDDQLAWSAEIRTSYERIGADVSVRTASLESRIDNVRHGHAFYEALGTVRREVAYSDWRAALGPDAAVVLDIIVHDVGLASAARIHRMHARRIRPLLLRALDLWPVYHLAAYKQVDEATLAAAQAGIL